MKYDQVFDALTDQEFAVIYWSCQGLTYGDIEEKFGYSVSWIQKRASEAHRKLGIGQLLPNKRAEILEAEICPALTAWIENHPDRVRRLPPPVVESREADKDARPAQAIVLDRPKPIVIIQKDKRTPWWVWLIVAVVVGVVGYSAYQIGRNAAPPATTALPTAPFLPAVSSPIPTQELPTLAFTSTPVPTEIPSETAAPTATAPPTETPFVPPANGILFEDNFDNGISPEWKVFGNGWLTSNGKLTVSTDASFSNRYGWLDLDHPEWKNYVVSLDVENRYGQSSELGNIAVAVRVGAQSKYVGVQLDTLSQIYWSLIQSSVFDSTSLAGPNSSFRFPSGSSIEIEANRNNYTLSVDSREIQTISYAGYDSGGVKLGVDCSSGWRCPLIDNFKVTYLP